MVKQLSRALRSKGPTKEIRHVQSAIRFQEHKRKQLEKVREEHKATKEYILAARRRESEKQGKIKAALQNAKEDWTLGPLRPNRALGAGKTMYGTTSREELQYPEVPEHWGTRKNLQKRMRTKIPDSVLYGALPIAVDDRVIIIKGNDKGRIGVVSFIDVERNSVTVKDLNKVFVDSTIFNTNNPSKQEWDLSLSIDDVRLVVPQTINGVRQDVIVESVQMEKHTSGKNLFTGEEEMDIPEDQQIDPETGERIWHRYIAGTRTRIEWPWEETVQKKQDARENAQARGIPFEEDKKKPLESTEDTEDKSRSVLDRARGAFGWAFGRKKTNAHAEETDNERYHYLDEEEERQLTRPREREPVQHDGDTTRNYIEDEQYMTWMPSLQHEPFPEGVLEEVAGPEWRQRRVLDRKADDFEERIAELRARKAAVKESQRLVKQRHADTMKTPLQVKWELAQAEKATKTPQDVPTDLLVALGEHMAAQQARK
ncbi:hypothetical protein B0J11DRAFT_486774 [Dendryphion nanum]|uniref:KOW domain-containing protein n=1 Tax=Dendryphion nanum TaxID=256645 RepID=A0A9P9IN80_9PLEO|nr:hypothetical protein B0J11DRAFT_486774 [Dendryphion nanum]